MAEARKPGAAAPPRKAKFIMQDDKFVIRVGSASAVIPVSLPKTFEARRFAEEVAALIAPASCFVAVYNPFGDPYRLACVERSSAKVRWVTRVWGSWWGQIAGFPGAKWLEVTEQGDRIVVFGVGAGGFHVEAFRVRDGVNVLRFSNSYSRW
jgi:hypothetical protein